MWQNYKFHDNEEETKVCKNLSRLIHTLQHFPSNRSKLDTTSLWNLVDELESFNPDRKTRSMQFTQTTERRTYSKKYLNLNISGESGKTNFSPKSDDFNQQFRNGKPEKFYNKFGNNHNQFKEKDLNSKPKFKNTNSYEPNKRKSPSCNDGVRSNNKTLINDEIKGNNFERSSMNKQVNHPRSNQLNNKNTIPQKIKKINYLNDPEKKTGRFGNSVVNISKNNRDSKESIYCNKITSKNKFDAVRGESRLSKPIRNQKTNFKCKSHQCTPNSNKALQQIILENDPIPIDKHSVVRKLTNYWNNLLNNELEQSCSTTESSGGSCQNMQILDHHLTHRSSSISKTQSENSSSTMKSRHMSESNINIMKRVDDLQSKICFCKGQNSQHTLLSQLKDVTHCEPASSPVEIINEHNKIIYEKKQTDFISDSQFSLLRIEDAIEVLHNTLDGLKILPKGNIEPFIRKMLYATVTAAMLKTKDDKYLNKLEVQTDKLIQEIAIIKQEIYEDCDGATKDINSPKVDNPVVGHILSAFNDNLHIDMDYIVTDTGEENFDSYPQTKEKSSTIKHLNNGKLGYFENSNCETTPSSENSLMPVTSRINFHTLENALNLFLLWAEIMWVRQSFDYDDIEFSNNNGSPFHSFTVFYEEDVLFEEDSSDEEITHNSKDMSKSNADIFRILAAAIESYVNWVIDILENNNPDSLEAVIRMVYQMLVSILVWWVIAKEIFVK